MSQGPEPRRCSHARVLWLGLLDSGRADTSLTIASARTFLAHDHGADDDTGHAASCLRALEAAIALRGACTGCLRLVCARVFGARDDGRGTRALSRAVVWLAALRVDVIAAPLSLAVECPRTRRAVAWYTRGGGRFVAAAGRTSPTLRFPAAWPGVIAVQGQGGAYPKADVPVEPTCDDSRAVMYRVAALLADSAGPHAPTPPRR